MTMTGKEISVVEQEDAVEIAAEDDPPTPTEARVSRRPLWGKVVAYGVLPGLALLLALGGAYLKWKDVSARDAQLAGIEAVRVASDSTVEMLSYKPDSVAADLGAAGRRLTGTFKDSYASLVHDVVVPGATQKHISAVATVPAAGVVSASPNHAVVLVLVDQTTTIGDDPPTNTASAVRVTLDKIADHWLISGFEPV